MIPQRFSWASSHDVERPLVRVGEQREVLVHLLDDGEGVLEVGVGDPLGALREVVGQKAGDEDRALAARRDRDQRLLYGAVHGADEPVELRVDLRGAAAGLRLLAARAAPVALQLSQLTLEEERLLQPLDEPGVPQPGRDGSHRLEDEEPPPVREAQQGEEIVDRRG